ncbi:hypothetical protein CPLU01_00316 [Colletotrichum plurivorum]|uniref:Polarity defective-2 n=1 Tax=Colletotrichum plurivorum TaxID=2175906 RepID=A0A8H6NSK6_9PEZI|nr:hypothetical protein CPLU01_00316 [Colletotrichum plurivorum]
MAPQPPKTNFKSYEAQARLLRAIVAAHPEVRWNYKEIVKHYGSDMTEHALNHRFRAIKAHVKVVQDAVAQGIDCVDIPGDLPKGKEDIAKFFGESTADGIQFQFRSIKKDADSLKHTANSGGNPATVLSLTGAGPSSAHSTPRKPARTPSSKTPRASGGGRSTVKKQPVIKTQPMSDEEDAEDEDVDYNALEDTPSKSRVRDRIIDGRVGKSTSSKARGSTPSRAATIAAAANIRQSAAVDLTTSDSEVETPVNTAAYEPAPVGAKPEVMQKQQPQQPFEQQHFAQPAPQPASSVYVAPSDFSQASSADLFSNAVMDDHLNFSFGGSFNAGIHGENAYMGAGDGEI